LVAGLFFTLPRTNDSAKARRTAFLAIQNIIGARLWMEPVKLTKPVTRAMGFMEAGWCRAAHFIQRQAPWGDLTTRNQKALCPESVALGWVSRRFHS
jgi:hypothetical protein